MSIKAYAALLPLSLALPASGQTIEQWQPAKWGMTEEQVIGAFQGAANVVPGGRKPIWFDERLATVYIYDVAVGGVPLQAYFLFDTGAKLDTIQLVPRDSFFPGDDQFGKIENSLASKYGEPLRSANGSRFLSAWMLPNSVVELDYIRPTLLGLRFESRKGQTVDSVRHGLTAVRNKHNFPDPRLASTSETRTVRTSPPPSGELPMQVPEWLRPFPRATGQTTHAASSRAVDLSYTAPASVEVVSGHYQEQLRAAGIAFQVSFDGIGTSVRAMDSKQSCVVRIVEVDFGVNVSANCAKGEPSKPGQPTQARPVVDASGLSPAQAGPPRSGPSPSGWQIVSIESRVTETNNVWSRYAWKLTLRNESQQPSVFGGTIEFQDRDGFIVDTSRADNLVVPAGSEQVFTGFALIRAAVAGNVARTVAKVGKGR